MTSRRKPKSTTPKTISSENNSKFNQTQIILTLISISITIFGTFLAYTTYTKSLPAIRLENWKVEFAQMDKGDNLSILGNSGIFLVTAEISNTGGSAVSLVKPGLEILYETVNMTPPSTVIPPIALTATLEKNLSLEASLQLLAGNNLSIKQDSYMAKDPKEGQAIMCALVQTGLLEFVDSNPTEIPPNKDNYEVSNTTFCIGSECGTISNDEIPPILAFSGDQQTIMEKLVRDDVTIDDTPIFIAPGETKRIFLAWYIPACAPYWSSPKSINIILNFNNKQTIIINLMERLKISP